MNGIFQESYEKFRLLKGFSRLENFQWCKNFNDPSESFTLRSYLLHRNWNKLLFLFPINDAQGFMERVVIRDCLRHEENSYWLKFLKKHSKDFYDTKTEKNFTAAFPQIHIAILSFTFSPSLSRRRQNKYVNLLLLNLNCVITLRRMKSENLNSSSIEVSFWQSGRYQHSISRYFRFSHSKAISLEHHKSFAESGFASHTMQFTVNNKSNKSVENLRNSSRRFIILAVELLCKWGMTALSIKIYLIFLSSPPCLLDVCVCASLCVAKCDYASKSIQETNWV